jgi:hypothetical protein
MLSESIAELQATIDELRQEMAAMSARVRVLGTQIGDVSRHADRLVASHRRDLRDRAQLAMPGGALRSDSIVVRGSPQARTRIARLVSGRPVEKTFSRSAGISRCVTSAPDVREHWERLLAAESHTDGVLRGGPSTLLSTPPGIVSKAAAPMLDVLLSQDVPPERLDTIAVPAFVHTAPARKLRNFSHWLLDCAPQIAALTRLVPGASVLLHEPLNQVQRSTLTLLGVHPSQMMPWNGQPIAAERIVVFESDGRLGGGRPLSALLEMRERINGSENSGRGTRRVFVSRRDAKSKRQWMTNQLDVERLFEQRGFDIVCPTQYSVPELVRIFGDAAVVAGINGAGLAHVLFSPPGTHLLVLFTDGLIRWHSTQGARAWWTGTADTGRELAPLGDSPRFYAHVAALFDQVCHSFVSSDDVPLAELARFVDEALGRAGGA